MAGGASIVVVCWDFAALGVLVQGVLPRQASSLCEVCTTLLHGTEQRLRAAVVGHGNVRRVRHRSWHLNFPGTPNLGSDWCDDIVHPTEFGGEVYDESSPDRECGS